MPLNRHHIHVSFAIIFLGTFAWILWLLFDNLAFPDTSYAFLEKSGRLELTPHQPVTEVFTATENHLRQINILLGDISLSMGEYMRFELRDATCTQVLATSTLNTFSLDPFIYTHFSFPDIANSQDHSYCLSVTYESNKNRTNRPYIGTSSDPQFAGWSYTDSGKDRTYNDRTLKIRPAYSTGSFFGDVGRLVDRVSQYKPVFLKGIFLKGLSLIFVVGVLFLTTCIIFTPDKKKED